MRMVIAMKEIGKTIEKMGKVDWRDKYRNILLCRWE